MGVRRWVAVAVVLGAVAVATPAGAAGPHFETTAANIPGYLWPVVGDFDGDGLDHDIYWYSPGIATDRLWLANGDRTFTKSTVNFGGDHLRGEFYPFVGHFDAGPTADIFWYSFGPEPDYVWYGQPNGGFRARSLQVRAHDYLPIAGDFDGNGVDDILWYSGGTRRDAIWFGNTNGMFTRTALQVWGQYLWAFAGDFNGDARTDLLWWSFDGTTHTLWMGKADGGFAKRRLTAPFATYPNVADYDGDGRSDIFWEGLISGSGALALAANGIANLQPMAIPSFSIAFVGNWNGDNTGRDDIVWPSFFPFGETIWLSTGSAFVAEPLDPPSLFAYADPVIGQFDSTATNNATDIIWYGLAQLPDRIDWGVDVDGPIPTFAAGASATGGSRLATPPPRLPPSVQDEIERHATR